MHVHNLPVLEFKGAVIGGKEELMLVMEYMDHGSLFDLLQNDTLLLEGEILLPILRDVAQGMRFLHAATPQVIHADLKAQNVLVDSKFRAKVSDFGLSQKRQVGAIGTPYWMAPELFLVLVWLNSYGYCATMVRTGLVRLLLAGRRREYRTSHGLADINSANNQRSQIVLRT